MASPDENVVEVPLSVVRVFTLSNPAKFSWETVRARLSLFTESVITSSDEQSLNSATNAIKTILLIIFVFITFLYFVCIILLLLHRRTTVSTYQKRHPII